MAKRARKAGGAGAGRGAGRAGGARRGARTIEPRGPFGLAQGLFTGPGEIARNLVATQQAVLRAQAASLAAAEKLVETAHDVTKWQGEGVDLVVRTQALQRQWLRWWGL